MSGKINWFPGHMKKSLEELARSIKLVDVVIYVLDARCPQSCMNPSFDKIIGAKKVIYYYSKRDLAKNPPPNVNVLDEIKKMFPERVAGVDGVRRFVRAMVVGVPNVGKSTLINKIAKRKKTKVEDRPGVTRQTQWIEVAPAIYLLDTPGILYPNIEDPAVARDLVAIAAIKRELKFDE